jgi:hypothetical protein
MIGKKPLQISFASVFELKTRVVETEAARRYILTEVQARFGTEDEKREITALEVKSADGNAPAFHDYVQQLIGEAGLAVGTSPWFEAARIKESGLKPVLSIKKIWKFNPSPVLRALAGGLLEFEKAYLDGCVRFEKQGVYKSWSKRASFLALILFQDAFERIRYSAILCFLKSYSRDG